MSDNSVIDEVRKIILEFPQKGDQVKKRHIVSVVTHSKKLARKLKADAEVCELAAWLHDIDKLKGNDKGHHIRGAKDAEKILRKLGYPEKKIKKVSYCILTHSSDKNYIPRTLEAKIVASADALTHFDVFLPIVYWYFKKGLTVDEAREKVLKKANNSYSKMMPYARKMVKKKYDAIRTLLVETKFK